MSYIGSKPANKPVVASDIDPTMITGQTALAVAPASTDEFLVSDAGTLKRIDYSLIGNSSYFKVAGSNVSASNDTSTELTVTSETVDSAGVVASNRFTPQVAGYYFITATVKYPSGTDIDFLGCEIFKNGSSTGAGTSIVSKDYNAISCSTIVELNGSSDYVSIFGRHTTGSTSNINLQNFFGFKLGN